jgi:hypothetical protein
VIGEHYYVGRDWALLEFPDGLVANGG